MRVAAVVLGPVVLLLACSGPGGGSDGGTPDGGADGGASTGAPCPDGRPDGCAGHICLTGEGGQSYCSEYCAGDAACPPDLPCQALLFGDAADVRSVCAPPCTADGACASGSCGADGRCVAPEGTVGEGGACGGEAGTCLAGLVCEGAAGEGRCMATCDPAEGAFCPSGAFCWPANRPQGGVCWLGGALAAGAGCESNLECPLGHLCVADASGARCLAGCDPAGGAPTCDAGVCTAIPDRAYGFCLE